MKKWYMWLVAALLIVGLLTACGTENQEERQSDEAQTEETEEQTTGSGEAAAFPITITDAFENEVTLEEEPEKIVTLIPSITETVFALDAGDKIVGRTDWCNFPEAVLEIETVGGMDFDVEKVISLQPDVVLAHASGAHSSADGLDQLRNSGIKVVIVNDAKQLEDVYKSIEMIGEVIGKTNEATNVIEDMQNKITELAAKAEEIPEEDRVNVWVEVSPDLYTPGKDTFLNELLQLLNATNVTGDQEGWPQFTEEDVVSINPDVIITTYGYYIENPSEEVKGRSAWKDVNAVANDRIYDVENDTVTRSGPRLAEGMEQLAKFIYPDVFEN
ncbi:ABC transporter substrate-binding protein [Alkalihalobacterium elongatum]|uniref:ABC transporter substrate-binding protein n=1 Tax=Alkalihalobacterium elongatum TaxID=2675466 RepID=UPI001C1FCD0C|nr:ABC transporter substrate-binding protein [Alkalihalobacterium elongatum]